MRWFNLNNRKWVLAPNRDRQCSPTKALNDGRPNRASSYSLYAADCLESQANERWRCRSIAQLHLNRFVRFNGLLFLMVRLHGIQPVELGYVSVDCSWAALYWGYVGLRTIAIFKVQLWSVCGLKRGCRNLFANNGDSCRTFAWIVLSSIVWLYNNSRLLWRLLVSW